MFDDEPDIERELKAALHVRPSPGFEAGVRRRIQEDRAPPLSLWPFGSLRSLRTSSLAAATAFVLAVGAWYLAVPSAPERVEEQGTAAAPDIRLEPPPGRPPIPPRGAGVEGERPNAGAPRLRETRRESGERPIARATARPSEPEVIVPPGQLAAIRRLVREVNAGRLMLPDSAPAAAAPIQIAVPPVVVEPIPIVTLEAGGGSQPGAKGLE